MSDLRLRELERRWLETGSKEDRKAYAAARRRAGLPPPPRTCIRHYVRTEDHGDVGPDGKFDLVYEAKSGRYPWDHDGEKKVYAACSVELWPRNLRAIARGWDPTMKKEVFYTEDPDEVTCKTCLKIINKPQDRELRRTHYAPGSRGLPKGGQGVRPVCGRNDSDKFTETFAWRMADVNCPACKKVMAKGKRRSRSPSRAG